MSILSKNECYKETLLHATCIDGLGKACHLYDVIFSGLPQAKPMDSQILVILDM